MSRKIKSKHQIIVISDLHLSEGMDSPREDFFYDLEFSDFIDDILAHKIKTHLVINGDFFDFLQVTSIGPYRANLREKKFGYSTSEIKSAWKLTKIFEGHKIFFRALVKFLLNGNKLFITKGNHDVELFWPRVQKTFLKLLNSIKLDKKIRQNLIFLPWYYYEPGLVYIEHGNQYDEINSFNNFLYPKLPGRDLLELPFGSFFLRYFFNQLERDFPMADNFKPTIEFLKWRISNYKIGNLPFLLSYVPFLLRTWWKTKSTFSKHKIAHILRKNKSALKKLDSFAPQIEQLKVKPIMFAKDFIIKIIKDHFSYKDLSYQIAKKIKEITKVKFVVMGHTHVARKRDFYFNLGTWTPIVSKKGVENFRKNRKLNYLLIKNNRAVLKEWAPL